MSDFPDPTAFVGRIGALTVVGDAYSSMAWTFRRRFEIFKRYNAGPLAGYERLADLRTLYALRWTVHRHPLLARPLLFFETVFVDDWEAYLMLLVAKSSVGINAHAAGAVGYPLFGTAEVFLRYVAEHHRPAGHVFVANPALTIVDLNQARVAVPRLAASSQRHARWFSVLVDVPPGRRAAVADALDRWNGGPSGFVGEGVPVHHGRCVLVEHHGYTGLLISAVHTVGPREAPSRTGYQPDATKTGEKLLHALLAGDGFERWLPLLRALDIGTASPQQAIQTLMRSSLGIHRNHAIRYVDDVWRRSPVAVAALAASYAASVCEGGRVPHDVPAESDRGIGQTVANG